MDAAQSHVDLDGALAIDSSSHQQACAPLRRKDGGDLIVYGYRDLPRSLIRGGRTAGFPVGPAFRINTDLAETSTSTWMTATSVVWTFDPGSGGLAQGQRGNPFFLFLHGYDVHGQYDYLKASEAPSHTRGP